MSFFRRKRREPPIMNRTTAMSMVPVRNSAVNEETGDDGQLQLAYDAMVRPWFAAPAEKLGLWDGKPLRKKVELDSMGQFVWDKVDGRNSVSDIAASFCNRYGVLRQEADLSVASFLKMLGERGIIALKE